MGQASAQGDGETGLLARCLGERRKAERWANRDSGTESANGGWLRRLFTDHFNSFSICFQAFKNTVKSRSACEYRSRATSS